MPIKGTDYLVVNRDNVDYKALVSDLNIPTDNAELANGANYITLAEVPDVDLDAYALKTEIPVDNTELTNGAGYITLSEVPEPDLEGALIFRGTVANERELPGDAVVGDLYYNEEDGLLYAKGESEWHALGEVAEVDLDGYATETWVEAKGYITIDQVPEVDLDPYALKTEIPTDNADLANGAGYITAADIDLDAYARLDGALFSGQIEVRNSNNWLRINSNWIQMTAEGSLEGQLYLTPASIYVSNDDNSKAFSVDAKTLQVDAEDFSVVAKEFVGDGSKLTNLPIPDVDAYTKAEADAKFMPLDISQLPTLS